MERETRTPVTVMVTGVFLSGGDELSLHRPVESLS